MAKRKYIDKKIIDEMCQLFMTGTSIPKLMKKYGFGRNKITALLKESLGDQYKEAAQQILKLSGPKSAKKNKGRKYGPMPEEQKRKISEGNRGKIRTEEMKKRISEGTKQGFSKMDPERLKEIKQKAVQTKKENGYYKIHSKRHSEWMKQNSPMKGKTHSVETRKKMSNARKKFLKKGGIPGHFGKLHSTETKKRLSDITHKMWEDNKFSPYKSKLEISIYESIKKFHENAKQNFRIKANGRIYAYDIYIPNLNLIIEVNGDYWHFNPELYKSSHYDQSRMITAFEKWKLDKEKAQIALNLNYKFQIIWENDITTFGVECVVNDIIKSHNVVV